MTTGIYEMSWKMYIPYNRRADMKTMKTNVLGQEYGLDIKMANGMIRGRSGLAERVVYSAFSTDEWIDVVMTVDLENKNVHVLIDNKVHIIAASEFVQGSSQIGLNSFFGMDFYNKAYSSKFMIDELCIKQKPNDSIDHTAIPGGIQLVDLRIL